MAKGGAGTEWAAQVGKKALAFPPWGMWWAQSSSLRALGLALARTLVFPVTLSTGQVLHSSGLGSLISHKG